MRSSAALPVLHRLAGRAYTQRQWEALCTRCGDCCRGRRWDAVAGWREAEASCRFLDPQTQLCRVYEDRRAREPACAAIVPSMASGGLLPAHCGYVEELQRLLSADEDRIA